MPGTHVRHLGRLALAALALLLVACDPGPTPTFTPVIPSAAPSATLAPQATVVPPAPTATLAAQPSPQPSAAPNPTAAQPPATAATQTAFKYPAPQLEEPKNGDGYGGQLIWQSFDLAADEYYHVTIYAVHNGEGRYWGPDTDVGKKEGKIILSREQFADKDHDWKTLSDSGWFNWQVQVMQKLPDGSSVPASPASASGTFFWERASL